MAKRILVVDDDRYLVEIYLRALTQEGYEVTCAYDGKEGLETVKNNPQVDLIVLDLKMPKMTGDEFLKALRSDSALKDIKVMVMSSVLYHYTEPPDKKGWSEQFGRAYMKKKGLSNIGKRAEHAQPTDMQEKKEQGLQPTGALGDYSLVPENQGAFEQEVSENLLKKVKEMFGETYTSTYKRTGVFNYPPSLIPDKVIELVAEYFKTDKEKILPDTSFEKDLKAYYLDCMPLRRKINKEFGVKLDFEIQRDNITTVKDLIFWVEYEKRNAEFDRKKQREKTWKDFESLIYIWIIIGTLGIGALIWNYLLKPHLK